MADFGTAFGGFAEGLAGGFTSGSANRIAQQNAFATAEERKRKAGNSAFTVALQSAEAGNTDLAKLQFEDAIKVGDLFKGANDTATKQRIALYKKAIFEGPPETRRRALEIAESGVDIFAMLRRANETDTPFITLGELFDVQSKALDFKQRQQAAANQQALQNVASNANRSVVSSAISNNPVQALIDSANVDIQNTQAQIQSIKQSLGGRPGSAERVNALQDRITKTQQNLEGRLKQLPGARRAARSGDLNNVIMQAARLNLAGKTGNPDLDALSPLELARRAFRIQQSSLERVIAIPEDELDPTRNTFLRNSPAAMKAAQEELKNLRGSVGGSDQGSTADRFRRRKELLELLKLFPPG